MEKKSRKEFHQLSEEQLQEVTGGGIMPSPSMGKCQIDFISCPSMKHDSLCNCIG